MPLKVRRFCTSIFLVLVSLVGFAVAQTPQQTVTTPPVTPPTSGDVMRARISKAKAFIAVRNYNAAIYELENIRRETNDPAVHGVVNVLLTNSYLEQGDYKRAQDLLNEFYKAVTTNKPNAPASYLAVAGQIIKGARNRVERYRTLGLSVSDRTLPLEATNDLEKMRETLELVITQAKEIGTKKEKAADAMALIEEAGNSRSMLARDDYDSRRWNDEVRDTREQMISPGTVIVNAVNPLPIEGSIPPALVAANTEANTKPSGPAAVIQTVAETKAPALEREREVKTQDKPKTDVPEAAQKAVAQNSQPVFVPAAQASQPIKKEELKPVTPAPEANTAQAKDVSPLQVGSLIDYATSQAQPVYPQAAKSFRTMGIVKVEITVDESGEVTEVQNASGPGMLQSAAKDAVRKWKFRPFTRDGQPVKATGFVSFNFRL